MLRPAERLVLGSRLLLIATAALAWAGCGRLTSADRRGARLAAAWTGSDSGRLVAPVRAEWCDSLGMLEIRAVQGDTGLAVAVFPASAPRPDSYPVLPPHVADRATPSAAVALRWFAETAIRGFQGDSGVVVIERADGRITGSFRSALRSVGDTARLDLQGSFRDVPVGPATRGCAPRPATGPGDSGID